MQAAIEKMAIVTAIREAEKKLGDIDNEFICSTAINILGFAQDSKESVKVINVYSKLIGGWK